MYEKESLKMIPIRQISDYLGIKRERNLIICPAHNDRHLGSCYLNEKTNTFKCYSCGAKGDSISLVAYSKHLDETRDFNEILGILADASGTPELYIASDADAKKGWKKYEEKKKRKLLPHTIEELEFIGLMGHNGGIDFIIGIDEECGIKESKFSKKIAEDTLKTDTRLKTKYIHDSLENLYQTDENFYLQLVLNKTKETLEYYYQKLENINNSFSKKIIANMIQYNIESKEDVVFNLCDLILYLKDQLKKANEIEKKTSILLNKI